MKLLIFNIKWLKTFKNMIKVYQVSRRYIMLIMHNNKYLSLIGLLTLLQWTIHNTACIVLHPAKYFDIYGVKWRQYVTPVVVCEHLCWLVIEKCQIDSFDVHYSKTLLKTTRTVYQRYICRFVCLYWVYFDRLLPVVQHREIFEIFQKYFRNISWNISGQKNHEILHH